MTARSACASGSSRTLVNELLIVDEGLLQQSFAEFLQVRLAGEVFRSQLDQVIRGRAGQAEAVLGFPVRLRSPSSAARMKPALTQRTGSQQDEQDRRGDRYRRVTAQPLAPALHQRRPSRLDRLVARKRRRSSARSRAVA